MNFSEDAYDKIQRYLDKELKGEELKNFESKLRTDKALADEVRLNADMQEMLSTHPENNLRNSLQMLSDEVTTDPNKSGNWLYFLLFVFFFVIAGGWYFYKSTISERNVSESPSNPKTEELKKETDSESEKSVPEKNEKPTDETPAQNEEIQKPEKKAEKPLKFADNKKKTESSRVVSRELFAANFEPNPNIDFLIENPVRSNVIKFDFEILPKSFKQKKVDDIVNLHLLGTAQTEESLSGKDFKFHVFSNRKAEFDDFLPLSTVDLKLEQAGNNLYRFELQKGYLLKPGLYYYLMEDAVKEKVYFVEKFTVE